MIINGDDLKQMKERNCGNCYHRNEKYKILGCKVHNKQVSKEHCCPIHVFTWDDGGL